MRWVAMKLECKSSTAVLKCALHTLASPEPAYRIYYNATNPAILKLLCKGEIKSSSARQTMVTLVFRVVTKSQN